MDGTLTGNSVVNKEMEVLECLQLNLQVEEEFLLFQY